MCIGYNRCQSTADTAEVTSTAAHKLSPPIFAEIEGDRRKLCHTDSADALVCC